MPETHVQDGCNAKMLTCMQAIWPALGGHAWSPEAAKLITALHTKLRAHSLQLLSRSYSTISPAKAAVLLGASEAELQPCELHTF